MLKEYYFPDSVQDALALLEENKGEARIIAGGTDLMVDYQDDKVSAGALVDISRIEELQKIECADGFIIIGAAVTHNRVAKAELILEHAPALAQAARSVGSQQIRNIATVAGNIISAQPAADAAVALVALGAEAEVVSDGKAEFVAVEKMYAGLGRSAVDSTTQLVTRIRFPVAQKNQGSAFVRFSRRKSLALPMLNVAAVVSINGGNKFQWARLVMAPVGPEPTRATAAEEMLKGSPTTDEVLERAARLALESANPRDSMIRGSREFRMGVLPVLVQRALAGALVGAKKNN